MWFTCGIGWWLERAGTQQRQIASRKPLVKLKIWTRRMFITMSSSLCVCLWPLKKQQELREMKAGNVARPAREQRWRETRRGSAHKMCEVPPTPLLAQWARLLLLRVRRCLCALEDSLFRVGRIAQLTNHNRAEKTGKNHLFQVFRKRFLQTERCLRYEWRHFYWPLPVCCVFLRVFVYSFREEKRNLEELKMFITRAH